MPGWVMRPWQVVSATEEFLLWVFGETGSPEVLGSRSALTWAAGLPGERSPMIHQVAEPTRLRAIMEFQIAAPISTGEAYPSQRWWVDHGIQANAVPTAGFWEAHAGYASTRSYAQGVSVALGWMLGVIDDPTLMTPRFYEDGTELSDAEREACAQVLHRVSVQPLPPPARPALAGPRSAGTDSWLA